ncbi:MAG: PKD domain-containing protein [Aestuariibaculum sp.]
MDKRILLLFIGMVVIHANAQELIKNDSITRTATITETINGNTVIFSPETPPLTQIAGAPKPFYTYFWEFGDGHFSKEKNPAHTYKNKGEYEVRLWTTNNYDYGKPPTTRPKKVNVNSVSANYDQASSMTNDFELIRNREPIPDEEMVAVVSYKNNKDYTTNGKLYLFYNELKYKANNFEILDVRTYNGEKKIPSKTFTYTHKTDNENTYLASTNNAFISIQSTLQDSTIKTNLPLTLEESKTIYKDWSLLEFDDMQPQEERHIFFSLKTTPEMIKDTSAIISVRGVYIPDSNYDNHKVKDMEMEIVTSHDPNKMSSNGSFMNYRFVRFKNLKFKIKFQNNGEGPARTIRLETDIPEMLDKSTIKILDMYPKCDICPKKEVLYSCLDTTYTDTQAIFTFKNIYLPGSEQKNVKEYDSTKGFVRYSIKFKEDFHKKKTKTRTAIIFDKNEPIITNYATTRFLPGISIGVKAGVNSYSDLTNSESYFLGATLSPYKSYRWYWQVELLNQKHNYDSDASIDEQYIETDGTQNMRIFQRTTNYSSYENFDLDVPVLIRYNVNNYIGLGAGLHNTITVSERWTESTLVEQYIGEDKNGDLYDSFSNQTENKDSFTNLRTGVLFEITGGFSRIGPSLGARYILDFEKNFNYWQFYAIWKF